MNAARNASQAGSPSEYLIDLPASYDGNRPYPLVLAFRGTPENAEMFRTTLNFGLVAGDETIIVHPETANGAPFWRAPDDVGLFETLLSHLLESYCIDTTQVFAMGYAQGGWLVSAFACQHGHRLRGAALFAGTKAAAPCQSPVAMLVVQGTADMQYSLSNGRETRDFWAALARCDTTQAVPLQGSPCVDYGACTQGAPVRYCEFVGGHELPSFAAAATWRFFSALR